MELGRVHLCSTSRDYSRLTARCLPRPQAREAAPAGWGIRWGSWPAGMRDNQWQSARFRRAASRNKRRTA